MTQLPIDPLLPAVVAALKRDDTLVIEAPPGAGKTTRVPPALLEAGLAGDRQIAVLQPRRIAARMAARRIAAERGTRVGGEVGYQVRYEREVGDDTRIVLMTEGLLLRRLLTEPDLDSTGVVVLDEFHERHVATDTTLALLRRLQKSRDGLKLVLMSATLESAAIADALECPVLRSEGRLHPVDVEFLEQPDTRRVPEQVASALRRLVRDGLDGDVLAFLPGVAEILRCVSTCREVAARGGADVVPLYGGLPPDAQDRAVRPGKRPKVILSTNVAETSVTIEGVAAVIDAGLARRPVYDPSTGLDTLQTRPISQASATQRTGRAGRVRAGRCLRLYTRHDFDGWPAVERPEVLRADLAETRLLLAAAGVREPGSLAWLDPPPPAAWSAATALLTALGALHDGTITPLGAEMATLPVHPRLSRMIAAGARAGVREEACWLAAIPGERSPRTDREAQLTTKSDLLDLAEDIRRAQDEKWDGHRLRDLGLAAGPARSIARAAQQLLRMSARLESGPRPATPEDTEGALLRAVLTGFSDRVGQRKSREAFLLCTGNQVGVAPSCGVREAEWIVAVATARRDRRDPRVTIASAIEPEWLLDVGGEWLRDETTLEFHEQRERVEQSSRLLYGALVIDESAGQPADAAAATTVLAEAALKRGPAAFLPDGGLRRLRGRIQVATAAGGVDAPELDDAAVRSALQALCVGRTSFRELRDASLLGALAADLPASVQQALRAYAPESLTLPGGRKLTVEYESGKPPWVESWLQDFFGMTDTPSLGGRTPVTMHLLAPNRRPVQVTNDLSGFWERHYPTLRKQLSRRYPKHDWPEDPARAKPPAPGGRRRRRK